MIVTVAYLTEAEAAGLKDQILDVYATAFAPAPYNRTQGDVIAFENSFLRHIRREGFRLAAARESGRLVGFAYG
ncbi:MAG TPA: hypothetical protein VF498_10000, partial [Anaerolineales bacterium]